MSCCSAGIRASNGRLILQLDASVCARIPVRTNTDDRYFTDDFQFMPSDGYTRMFERMLDHPLITTRLGVGFDELLGAVRHRLLVWTGPIDAHFGHCLGTLPYRSLSFSSDSRVPDGSCVQPVGQVNFPAEDVPYTRVTEYRHLRVKPPPAPRSPTSSRVLTATPTTRCPVSRIAISTSVTAVGGLRARRRVRRAPGALSIPEHGSGCRSALVAAGQAFGADSGRSGRDGDGLDPGRGPCRLAACPGQRPDGRLQLRAVRGPRDASALEQDYPPSCWR